MEVSVLYRRAAGYFTSAGLALAARGIASLASRGGTMQLVVSPHLQPDDLEALQTATSNPTDALRAITARGLADIEDALLRDRLNALAWLAATGLLEIKLALRLDANGGYSRGIFHEKAGIFTDLIGNHVAFSGSSNETAGGLVENFESIKVFCSWKDREGRVQEEIDNFDALWNNSTPGLRVIEFSKAGKELLERYRILDRPPAGLPVYEIKESAIPQNAFSPPSGFGLRPYQAEAIHAWSKAGGRGIFAMATGSGKTLTALTLACKVAEKNQPLVLIVVCPFINLCRQWVREIAAFGLQSVACFEGSDRWLTELEEGYQRLAVGLSKAHAIVVTNSTFMSNRFQSIIRTRVDSSSTHHLLIADEVHNLGAKNVKNFLPDGISMRLGLSATPERHFDPIGTSAVFSYFGDVIYNYPISQAIAEGRLCPYRYYPVLVELTDSEVDEYAAITSTLSKYLPKNDDEEVSTAAMKLLIRRARLLGGAMNKMVELERVIRSLSELPKKAVFYCGDGRTTDAITDEEVRQIQAVSRLLGELFAMRVRNFTYRESSQEREEILRDLSSGFLDGVVAIRCLDEGIDLPDLQMGFLMASSTNPRQFVQRRGRLLRNAPGKTRSIIFDFIIRPPDLGGKIDDDSFNMERDLFRRELTRIVEFCRTAENGPDALHSLRDLRLHYNLISE